jgi:hypothetical protein
MATIYCGCYALWKSRETQVFKAVTINLDPSLVNTPPTSRSLGSMTDTPRTWMIMFAMAKMANNKHGNYILWLLCSVEIEGDSGTV